jgi:hypothetical protein
MTELVTLLNEIAEGEEDSLDLLVELACDYAARVAGGAPSPIRARKWLRAARSFRNNPDVASEAARLAKVAVGAVSEDGQAHSRAEIAAARAIDWATTMAVTWLGTQTLTGDVSRVSWAADFAQAASVDPEAERAWQIKHTLQVMTRAEIGTQVAEWGPAFGARSRISLLAC